MTESERIIQEKILPESFFEEEVRNDFLVTTTRKKIWAVQLDLLLRLDQVCQKHHLKYVLCCGTLLGAIRHHGFIPWDDDLDVEMPRQDYEMLLKLSNEFSDSAFLQTPYTDPYYAFSHTRLININTTAFSKAFAFQPMKAGIFIDIFPVDRWVENDWESREEINRLNIENSIFMRLKNPYLDERDKKRVAEWSGINPLTAYEEIQKIATKYNNTDTIFRRRIVITSLPVVKLVYAEDFNPVFLHSFENFQFPVPGGYDRMLTREYGDYMQLPPAESRGTWHSSIIIDPDEPYTSYIEKYIEQLHQDHQKSKP